MLKDTRWTVKVIATNYLRLALYCYNRYILTAWVHYPIAALLSQN